MSEITALDSQDLRARLRRRLTWAVAAAGVAALLAVVSAVVLVVVDNRLSAEQAEFDHYDGEITEIVDTDGEGTGGLAMVIFEPRSRVRFANIEIDNTASFTEGPATVLVDPNDPDFVTLPGENYFPDGEGLAYLLIGGLGACALALAAAAFVTRRTVQVLASSTWQTVSGFVTTANDGDSKRWVLYLSDHANGTFWISKRKLPMPSFTGSVAIDEKGRLVLRLQDGKRLAFAKRADTTSYWSKHRVSSASILGTNLDVAYTARDEPWQCSILLADGAPMPQLRAGDTIGLLGGPLHTVTMHVPDLGIVGLGVPRTTKRVKKTRATTAPEATS